MAAKDTILTEQNYERINQGLQSINDALELIDLAKQAGLDVDQQDSRAKQTRDQLLRLKNTFFPGR